MKSQQHPQKYRQLENSGQQHLEFEKSNLDTISVKSSKQVKTNHDTQRGQLLCGLLHPVPAAVLWDAGVQGGARLLAAHDHRNRLLGRHPLRAPPHGRGQPRENCVWIQLPEQTWRGQQQPLTPPFPSFLGY